MVKRSQEIEDAILDGLADGQSLRAICRDPKMPNVATVIRWLLDDETFSAQYARARANGDDAMAEDIQDIADNPGLDANDKRVRIDARKWLLGKRQPKKYGDKIEHEHKGSVTVTTGQYDADI